MGDVELEPLDVLGQSRVLRHLPPESIRVLAGLARKEAFSRRTLLVAQGQRSEYIRYVVDGHIDLTLSAADGKSIGFPIYPGGWASWAGCFSERPSVHDIWSSKSAVFLALPCRLIRAEIIKHPNALLKVTEHIGEANRALVAWALAATIQSPERRLAYMIMALSGTHKPPGEQRGHAAITQEEIGRLGFGSRQRVARLLRSLELKGLIERKYGGIAIASPEILKAFVSGGAAAI